MIPKDPRKQKSAGFYLFLKIANQIFGKWVGID
jgi:hypothetical protein